LHKNKHGLLKKLAVDNASGAQQQHKAGESFNHLMKQKAQQKFHATRSQHLIAAQMP
jgi:hypothetical protein